MNEQKSSSIYSLLNQITFISLTACSQSDWVDETGSGWLFVLKLYDSSLFGESQELTEGHAQHFLELESVVRTIN